MSKAPMGTFRGMGPIRGVCSTARRITTSGNPRKILKAVIIPMATKVVLPVAKEVASSVLTDRFEKAEEENAQKKPENKGNGGAAEHHQDQHLGVNDNDIQEKEHEQDNGPHMSLLEGLEKEGLPYVHYVHLVEVVGGEKRAYLARIEVIRKPPFSSFFLGCKRNKRTYRAYQEIYC
jgi:hypothetical protein